MFLSFYCVMSSTCFSSSIRYANCTYKVEAILGLQTLEEVLSVGEIGSNAQIPTLSLLDSVP
ncbi:hypothetical protein Hanom_Chr10g00939111 [Helianthus anomalus]